jgi:hypothetical protein
MAEWNGRMRVDGMHGGWELERNEKTLLLQRKKELGQIGSLAPQRSLAW